MVALADVRQRKWSETNGWIQKTFMLSEELDGAREGSSVKDHSSISVMKTWTQIHVVKKMLTTGKKADLKVLIDIQGINDIFQLCPVYKTNIISEKHLSPV